MPDIVSDSQAGENRYVVVARRYRPRSFDELIGQAHVGQALKNAIETERVGHAYLFTGARGVGKTSTARIFAKALNAPEGSTVKPDNDSDVCQAIDAGDDIDVLEIDGASNRGIDEIRSLRAGIGVRPSRSRYKIYIIDEVHMLTQAAFNALLKTLEEPPAHVKFIFCTTDPEKIPITVLSRCQRFDFVPVQPDEIMKRLREIVDAEKVEADEEALRLLARRAAGSMRDSQSLLEQVLSFSQGRVTADSVHGILGTADDTRLNELAAKLLARDACGALQQADAAVLEGIDPGQLLEQLLGYFRDLMIATVGCEVDMLRYSNAAMHQPLRQSGQQWGLSTVLAVVGLLDHTLVRIRHSVHARVLLETVLIQICQLPDLQQIADVVSGLSEMEKKKPSVKSKSALVANQETQNSSPPSDPVPPRPLGILEAKEKLIRKEESVSATSSATTQRNQAVNGERNEASRPVSSVVGLPESVEWTGEGVKKLWRVAVSRLDDMTAELAKQVSRVEMIAEGKLRVFFPKDQSLSKLSCGKPERKSKLEAALHGVAAQHVHIELAFDTKEVHRKPVAAPARSIGERKQRQRALKTHPLVQQCVELFEAEIIRIEESI